MSTTEMEEAILNGQPVAGPSSSSRSRSASPTNTDDELGSDLEQEPSDEAQSSTVGPPRTSGPQTGVKGVAADAKHQKAIDRHNKNEAIKNRDQYLLNKSFQAQTLDEEDADRRKAQQIEDQDEEERLIRMRREARMKELRNAGNNRTSQEDDDDQDENGSIYRQRLREVDADGFLKAVEQPGWTLVLLYELGVERCYPYLQAFLELSSSLRPSSTSTVTYLRARATLLSFSLLPSSSVLQTDPDVLPTILVYRAGELQESFIRVDMEVGEGDTKRGLQRVFAKHGIPSS